MFYILKIDSIYIPRLISSQKFKTTSKNDAFGQSFEVIYTNYN